MSVIHEEERGGEGRRGWRSRWSECPSRAPRGDCLVLRTRPW